MTVVIVTRHITVAQAVMDARCIAITVALTRVAVVPALAATVVVRDGVATSMIAIMIRPGVIAIPTGDRTLLIGGIRCKSARSGVGRPLIDKIVLRGRLGQPLILPAVAAAGG